MDIKAKIGTELAEQKALAESAVANWNKGQIEDKIEDVRKAEKVMDEAVKKYCGLSRQLCFIELAAKKDPMLEAIKQLNFPIIHVKEDRPSDDNPLPVRHLEDRSKRIDLYKLHNSCKDGIGHDRNWWCILEKMNYLLAIKAAKDLGVNNLKEIKDTYLMSEIARQYDMGKDPTSNTSMLKTLQAGVTAMLGPGYKALSRDVKYLELVYSKKGKKALSVCLSNHANFRNLMMEVCYRIVTKGSYTVEGYNADKERAKALEAEEEEKKNPKPKNPAHDPILPTHTPTAEELEVAKVDKSRAEGMAKVEKALDALKETASQPEKPKSKSTKSKTPARESKPTETKPETESKAS